MKHPLPLIAPFPLFFSSGARGARWQVTSAELRTQGVRAQDVLVSIAGRRLGEMPAPEAAARLRQAKDDGPFAVRAFGLRFYLSLSLLFLCAEDSAQ